MYVLCKSQTWYSHTISYSRLNPLVFKPSKFLRQWLILQNSSCDSRLPPCIHHFLRSTHSFESFPILTCDCRNDGYIFFYIKSNISLVDLYPITHCTKYSSIVIVFALVTYQLIIVKGFWRETYVLTVDWSRTSDHSYFSRSIHQYARVLYSVE